MSARPFIARALQLAERIDLKGLERTDQFSTNPLAFKTSSGGTVVLFRFGAAVFIGMNPLEEEAIIKGLECRLIEPIADRESETVQIVVKADGEDQPLPMERSPSKTMRRSESCCWPRRSRQVWHSVTTNGA